MTKSSYNTLALLLPMIIIIGAIALIPAHIVNAEEPCLRGGSGDCVELSTTASSTEDGHLTSPLGGNDASNIIVLKDGTMVALVADRIAESFTNTIRHEINVYVSDDSGLSWQKKDVQNKGHWYVDEILDGSHGALWSTLNPAPRTWGAEYGPGFLGFSASWVALANSDYEYIFLSHTMACATNNGNVSITFGDPYRSSADGDVYKCDSLFFSGGTIFGNAIQYDSETGSFTQIGETTSLTRSASRYTIENPQIISGPGIEFGGVTGTMYPSMTVESLDTATGEAVFWISYSAYLGDLCAIMDDTDILECMYQNGKENPADLGVVGKSYSQLWARRVDFDPNTAPHFFSDETAPTAPEVNNSDNFLIDQIETATRSGTNRRCTNDPFSVPSGTTDPMCHDERYAYISSMQRTGWGASSYPVIFYGYTKHGDAESQIQWATFDTGTSQWNDEGYLIDDIDWENNQTPTILYAGADSALAAENTSTTIIPSLSTVASQETGWQTSSGEDLTRHEVIHLTAYADISQENGYLTAMPVYIRLHKDGGAAIDYPLEGLVLGKQSTGTFSRIPDSTADCAVDNQECVKVFVESGGPSIGHERNRMIIAVPGAQVGAPATPLFAPQSTNIFYTILAPSTQDVGGQAIVHWSDPMSNTWLDTDGIDVDYPIYGQLTETNPSNNSGFASPVLVKYIKSLDTWQPPPVHSNIFAPPMLFTKSENPSNGCSASNGEKCSIHYSGERYTNGIRGWAWADTIGWVSLSCNNLQSCYKRSYATDGTAWSSREGGFYYGVRAVMFDALDVHTLIGKMWSERVGYLSFNRADNVSASNPCGNPPDGYEISPTSQCAIITADLAASDATMTITTVDGSAINFPTQGSLLIDEEVLRYSYNPATDVSGNVATLTITNRGDGTEGTYASLSNLWYISTSRDHKVIRDNGGPNPVFWIRSGDVTHPTYEGTDIYQGINTVNSISYDLNGWARAESWKKYQESYCAGSIGTGNPPPCDKEWGWLKLDGLWETVHNGELLANATTTCASDRIYVDSVDGYPDPDAGTTEKVYLDFNCVPSGTCATEWEYSSVNRQDRYFQLDSQTTPNYSILRCYTDDAGKEVSWMTKLSGGGILSTYDIIPVDSINGFNATGKVEIIEGANREVVRYGQIDIDTNELLFVDRGLDGTTPQDFTSSARVLPIKETGTYQSFAFPLSAYAPEITIAGFSWSAPNTDLPTADPFSSRYRNNISGFGWLNFQPGKIEQIYPYLQTLFNDVYIGGEIEIIGPGNIDPRQFTSTYLLQGDGVILPFQPDKPATSGQYTQCFENCGGAATCEQQCEDLFYPSEAPGINLEPSAGSVFGRLPDTDAISTWVSGCRNHLGDLINGTGECPPADEQARHIALDGTTTWGYTLTDAADPDLAMSGINKYGHHVVHCRTAPSVFIGGGAFYKSPYVFGDGGYLGNPEECKWQWSRGYWEGELTQAYTVGDNYVCVNITDGSLVPQSTYLQLGLRSSPFVEASPSTGVCSTGTELTLTREDPHAVDQPAGTKVIDADFSAYYKVRHSHLGLPTVYTISEEYANQYYGMFQFDYQPMQFNDGDQYVDWDTNGDGFANDLIEPTGTIKESGAITIITPGSAFMMDSPSRYCPKGHDGLPCRAEEDQADAVDVSSISQIASIGWIINGSIGHLDAFRGSHSYIGKNYRVGAFLLFKDENEGWKPYSKPGTFLSPFLFARNAQWIFEGLVIAPNFYLTGEYYVQDETGEIVEPAENFVYDGRVLLNPPPGFEDLSTGLPTITRTTP